MWIILGLCNSANVAEISMLKSAKVDKGMVRKRKKRDADVEERI